MFLLLLFSPLTWDGGTILCLIQSPITSFSSLYIRDGSSLQVHLISCYTIAAGTLGIMVTSRHSVCGVWLPGYVLFQIRSCDALCAAPPSPFGDRAADHSASASRLAPPHDVTSWRCGGGTRLFQPSDPAGRGDVSPGRVPTAQVVVPPHALSAPTWRWRSLQTQAACIFRRLSFSLRRSLHPLTRADAMALASLCPKRIKVTFSGSPFW